MKMKIKFVNTSQLANRKDGILSTLTATTGVGAIVLGAVIEPGHGSVLSMVGALLVLVRALLGVTSTAHARRAQIAREAAALRERTLVLSPRPNADPTIDWPLFDLDSPRNDQRAWLS